MWSAQWESEPGEGPLEEMGAELGREACDAGEESAGCVSSIEWGRGRSETYIPLGALKGKLSKLALVAIKSREVLRRV